MRTNQICCGFSPQAYWVGCKDSDRDKPLHGPHLRGINGPGGGCEDYCERRSNGTDADSPSWPFPRDGVFTWDSSYATHSKIRYTAGPGDQEWMIKRDRNYVFRLEREGQLDNVEPRLSSEVPELYAEVMEFRRRNAAEREAKLRAEREQQERIQREQEVRLRAEQEQKERAEREAREVRERAEQIEISRRAQLEEERRLTEEVERQRKILVEVEKKRLEEIERQKKALAEVELKKNEPARAATKSPSISWIKIPESFLCPITQEPMIDPVTTVDGQTYERGAIEAWLKDHDTSPLTGAELADRKLTPNYALKSAIAEFQTQLPEMQRMQIETSRKCLEETSFKEALKAREVEIEKYKKLAEEKEKSRFELEQKLKMAEAEKSRTRGLQNIQYRDLTYGVLLGQGGYCVVFAGKWQNGDVAIKELLAKRLSDDSMKEFKKETDIWGRLHHPNIVQLYGVSTDQPQHCSMVMELMPNGSLYQVLHNGQPLSWEIRFHIAKDVAAGLTHLHEQEILHCDLKSMNVLLDGTMRAKLTDFGLSKVKLETQTTTAGASKALGTIRWMPPELLKRGGKHGKESDVYSFGVILWELTSRKIPYEDAADDAVVIKWIGDGEKETIPEDCAKAYPSYAALISACWKERSRRPTIQAAAEVLKPLEAVAETASTAEVTVSGPVYRANLASAAPK